MSTTNEGACTRKGGDKRAHVEKRKSIQILQPKPSRKWGIPVIHRTSEPRLPIIPLLNTVDMRVQDLMEGMFHHRLRRLQSQEARELRVAQSPPLWILVQVIECNKCAYDTQEEFFFSARLDG